MRAILIMVAAMALCGCTGAERAADCAALCRGLDMRLAYVEVEPYGVGASVQSCTCAAKEE